MKYFFSSKIEFLHETNRALERRLQELTDLKRDLSNKQFEERLKNDDLLRDLKDIDRLARKVQADKQYTVEAADRELTEAKVSFEEGKEIVFFFILNLISGGNRT
jgi:predicted ribosome quality control (RQC) complex YloA/Tae2 family protein